MSTKSSIVKYLKISAILLAVIFIGLILFIKLDTPVAAEFTDNVLRPLFGNEAVIFMEKVFYNTSDKFTQITYKPGSTNLFTENGGENLKGGNLDLTPLETTPGLIPVKNEGVWFNKPLKIFPNKEALAFTFIRPDQSRPYAFVTLVQADMSLLRLGDVAGISQPGGPVGNPGPGKIPSEIVNGGALVAAFDGGFQYRDGAYGMIVGDKTYLPLKNDIGTLIGFDDGSFKIINYQGQDLGKNVAFVRQNCPILIENGELSVTNSKNKSLWGRTLTSDIYTWRSGVGVTKGGNLIYAVGNNLTPTTLAYALKMGGAVNAIQLDINPFWVRFSIFDYQGNGGYSSTALMKGVYDGAKKFLGGYEKDFFYLYKK